MEESKVMISTLKETIKKQDEKFEEFRAESSKREMTMKGELRKLWEITRQTEMKLGEEIQRLQHSKHADAVRIEQLEREMGETSRSNSRNVSAEIIKSEYNKENPVGQQFPWISMMEHIRSDAQRTERS